MFRFASSRRVVGAEDRRCDVMRAAKSLASAAGLLAETVFWIPLMMADDEVIVDAKQQPQQGDISMQNIVPVNNVHPSDLLI